MNRLDGIIPGLVLALALGSSQASAQNAAQGHQTLPPGPAAAGDSIYLLEGSYTDQEGKEVGLDVFRGHPVLISMFYATCPHACPMLIADIKRIEKALPPESRKELRVILVTFDPERDTVPALHALAKAHGLDSSRWKMLRTDPSTVEELAAVLGIKYRFATNRDINHSSTISLLDRKGVVVDRLEGLRQPEGPLVRRVIEMPK